MKTRSFMAIILLAGMTLVPAFDAEEPSGYSIKSSKDLLRKWSPTRSLAAPKMEKRSGLMTRAEWKRLQAASLITRGAAPVRATRGIEVEPVNAVATAGGPESSGLLPVSVTVDSGSLASFPNIRFKLDSTEFADEGSVQQIEEIAGALKQLTREQFLVEGHTCDLGTDEHNQDLSERRARAVFDQLVQRGVNPSQLATMGMGESTPVASNAEESSRQLNRRVVVARRLDQAAVSQ